MGRRSLPSYCTLLDSPADPLSKCSTSQRAVHATLPSLGRAARTSPGSSNSSGPDIESTPGSQTAPLRPQLASQHRGGNACKLGSACEELEAPGGGQEGHPAGPGTSLKADGKPGSLDEDMAHGSLGDSLRAEADPRLRIMMALTKVGGCGD